jgi:ATP-dependent DNA ligase
VARLRDGYRAIDVKSGREALLYLANAKNFSKRFLEVAGALRDLSARHVIDGEVKRSSDSHTF